MHGSCERCWRTHQSTNPYGRRDAFRLGRPELRQVAILFNDITKRKQAEQALHRTQALNQTVLGSLAANIAVLDREGNIIAVNEAWKRFAYENDGAAVADSVGFNYLQVCRDAPESRNGGWAALNGIQAVLTALFTIRTRISLPLAECEALVPDVGHTAAW